jgi:hypothetical protein
MPIRGVGDDIDEVRWVASFRYIDGIEADRARERFTLNYRFTESFQAGIEWNPLAHDLNPLANWTALEETELRPALILGTSSDRIGTEEGQSWYATLSKSLEPWLGLPVAPYVGTAYRDADHDWEPIAGLHYQLLDGRLLVTHIWDGENLHLTVDVPWRRAVFNVIVAQQEDRDGSGKEYFLGVGLGLRLPQLGWLRD